MCEPKRVNLALLGDLTTLYDFSGFYAASKLPGDVEFSIIVINNGGGLIFSHILDDARFLNLHSLDFEHVAAQWSLDYEFWTEIPKSPSFNGRRLIEIRPDKKQTEAFFKAYGSLWSTP